MPRRRAVAASAVTLAALTALAACGSSSSGGNTPAGSGGSPSASVSVGVKAGGSYKPASVTDLCGKNVAVEKGTTELDQATAQAKKCHLSILAFPDENGANLALQSGRADVVFADTPVNDYAKALSNGAFVAYPYTAFATAPYGIAVPKTATYAGLSQAIQLALQDLSAKGIYQKILQKWHIQGGAISDFTINGAKS